MANKFEKMKITLNQVMPFPLASMQHGEHSIWGKEIELLHGNKIMLNASSGKGKSTFIHTVLGIRKDYTGSVMFDSSNISQLSTSDWTNIRQQQISAIFQDLQLFPSITVKENLLLKNNLTQTFSTDEIFGFLDSLGISDKWEQQCGLLSMGQQQRVAIVRALCQPFDWLLMDEPFSHLDEENTQRCLKLIIERCAELKSGFVLTSLGDDHGIQYDQTLML
jgi:ABC-type lipoprotein export system ATPase subunit